MATEPTHFRFTNEEVKEIAYMVAAARGESIGEYLTYLVKEHWVHLDRGEKDFIQAFAAKTRKEQEDVDKAFTKSKK